MAGYGIKGKIVINVILIATLCACGDLGSVSTHKLTEDSSREDSLRGKIFEGLIFSSDSTSRQHRYKIYLPAGYSTSDKSYPVLYMTDAQWGFHFYAEALDWKERKVLLVGVDSGADRFSDFAGEGTDAYARFLKNEFVPFIEREYRCADERAYMGVSLGALFGAHLLIQESVDSAYFQYYLLFDGTYQFLSNENIAAEKSRFERNPLLKTNIFLTSAWPGNRRPTKLFEERYREREYQGLKLIHKPFDIDHKGIAAPSYSHFVDKLFMDDR